MSYIINNRFTSLNGEISEGKKQISDAIIAKGGTSDPEHTFSQLAGDIMFVPNYSAFAKLAAVLMESYASNATEGITKTNKIETTDITDPFGLCESVRDYTFQYMLITSVSLPNVTSVGGYAFYGCSALQSVSMPNLQTVSGIYIFSTCRALHSVIFGKLLSFTANIFTGCTHLAKITIGVSTDINLNFSIWSPTSIPSSEDAQFNIDFMDGIVNNLYDYTGGTAHTLTLSANVLGRLTQETLDALADKNWNVL